MRRGRESSQRSRQAGHGASMDQTRMAQGQQPTELRGSWQPSHYVPPQGLLSWAKPDPSQPVVTTLAPGVPIQVTEVTGAWARVVCSNGWAGWIDARIIGLAP
jgi:hypothetical protein